MGTNTYRGGSIERGVDKNLDRNISRKEKRKGPYTNEFNFPF